jgi:hypothetical protein
MTTLIDTILSDVDRIEDVLWCGAGNGGRPYRDASLRKVLLGHAAQLVDVGMPGTAALVLELVERIDGGAGRPPHGPRESARRGASDEDVVADGIGAVSS